MGYETYFEGSFKINKPITGSMADYLKAFMTTRRMKRDPEILNEMYKGQFGLSGMSHHGYGFEGEYYAKEGDDGEDFLDKSILDNNEPPGQLNIDIKNFDADYKANQKHIKALKCTPSLWCPWEFNATMNEISIPEEGKHYEYDSWIKYLINRFFEPAGYELSGTVHWYGEERRDNGKITIVNNQVSIQVGRLTYR